MVTGTDNDALTLLGMEVKSFMGIRFASVDFHDGLNKIGGLNGQGKTSLREGAIVCLGGGRYMPEEPVRRGDEQAQIVLRFDRFVVKRVIAPDGKTDYKLTTPDGKPFPGGSMKMLEQFREAIAFDPQRFSSMQPRDQADLLKKLVGLDFSDLDTRRAELAEERNTAGRDRKGRETQLLAMTTFPEVPAEEVNVSDLVSQLELANERNYEVEKTHNGIAAMVDQINVVNGKIAHAKKQIAMWQEQVAVLEKQQTSMDQALSAARMGLEEMTTYDTAVLRHEIADAETVNRKVRANLAHRQAKALYEQAVEDYRRLDKAVAEIDRQKSELVAKAKLPVEGIGFSESGVTFNGHPYAQASDAEKLRVSTAIGLALHPEFPNIWITDGSLLDRNSIKMIADMAAAVGGRVLVEVVTDDPSACDILIDDGMVKSGATGK